MLKSGLALLSDTKTESGLSKTFLNVIKGIVKLRKNGYSEAQSIAEIAQKIIMRLVHGSVIMIASHYNIPERIGPKLLHPEKKGWEGLALGKRFSTCVLLRNGNLKVSNRCQLDLL